jgi:hypothetical protein
MIVHYSSLAFCFDGHSLLGVGAFDGAEDYFPTLVIFHPVGYANSVVVPNSRRLQSFAGNAANFTLLEAGGPICMCANLGMPEDPSDCAVRSALERRVLSREALHRPHTHVSGIIWLRFGADESS